MTKQSGLQPGAPGAFHRQILFGTAFTFLTSGVFLSGLAMYMGAGDLLVSYISMIVNICGVSILFFSGLVGRFRSYKSLAVSLTALSRAATLLLVLIPLAVPKGAQLAVFVPLMVLAFTLQAQTTVVLNNWLVTFVSEQQSGRYIAKRQTIVLTATVVLSLAGGRVMDAVNGAYVGFLLLFFAAFLMAAGELVVLLRIPDGVQARQTDEKRPFWRSIGAPLRCRPYLGFVVYIFLFYLFMALADSFTVVYMMRYLQLSYAATTGLQLVISLPQIFLLGFWGKLGDQRGHRFALAASICFFVGEMLFMGLSNLANLYLCIPIAFLFAAMGNAGFVVSVFNRRYELMPQQDRIVYDNFYSAAVGLAFILGPLTGGAIKQLLETTGWGDQLLQFGSIRLLYLLAAAGITLLQLVMHGKAWRPAHKVQAH